LSAAFRGSETTICNVRLTVKVLMAKRLSAYCIAKIEKDIGTAKLLPVYFRINFYASIREKKSI
jgi:hypothetical protein